MPVTQQGGRTRPSATLKESKAGCLGMLLEVLQSLQGKEWLKKAKRKKNPRERKSFLKIILKNKYPHHGQQNPRATRNGKRCVNELQADFALFKICSRIQKLLVEVRQGSSRSHCGSQVLAYGTSTGESPSLCVFVNQMGSRLFPGSDSWDSAFPASLSCFCGRVRSQGRGAFQAARRTLSEAVPGRWAGARERRRPELWDRACAS